MSVNPTLMSSFDTFFGNVLLENGLKKLDLHIDRFNNEIEGDEGQKNKPQTDIFNDHLGDNEQPKPGKETIVVGGFKIGLRRRDFETTPVISIALSQIKAFDERIQDIAFSSKVHFLVLSVKINERWEGIGYWDEETLSGQGDFSKEASENIDLIVKKLSEILQKQDILFKEQSSHPSMPTCSSSELNSSSYEEAIVRKYNRHASLKQSSSSDEEGLFWKSKKKRS